MCVLYSLLCCFACEWQLLVVHSVCAVFCGISLLDCVSAGFILDNYSAFCLITVVLFLCLQLPTGWTAATDARFRLVCLPVRVYV